ncbi:toxin-antitoxin system YwqK family antitoxin [Chryseobacterium salviniae]|uniref:MORN repeat protein n=1 Tax=Chryseobacterium salviniae TaxID=3101750 RepID=A0ABU6HMA9_9FLAO|nr:hypothetical protein [Chryseobacterium sp. T9W2-O]MEC3874205.1 hypothetical protein [Chryseobacterium sp. T9W2-O]
MKRKLIFIICFLIMFISCNSVNNPNHPKWLCNKKIACKKHPILEKPKRIEFTRLYNNSEINFKYIDFPNEDQRLAFVLCEDEFEEGGLRKGQIIDGYKEGKWLSGDADFDDNGTVYAKGGIWREEYFKNGLRDSIYRRFDADGKIIYETIFKKGTGLWKELHSNGALYFEMYTKDGYFTDTLRLHDDKGKIIGKRLYKKDSLVYEEGLPCFPYRPSSVPSD